MERGEGNKENVWANFFYTKTLEVNGKKIPKEEIGTHLMNSQQINILVLNLHCIL